jgi:HK97 family phage prohead protease
MDKQAFRSEIKALDDERSVGKVTALVSVFNNEDYQGDRVVPGAFTTSIEKWKASGDQVPVIFSHDWGDLWAHIGVVDDMKETDRGLLVDYTLDIADNPAAAQVYRLMKRRTLKEHSFGYNVIRERAGKDGINELLELDIIEVGPTLKGANPETELLAVKSAIETGMQLDRPRRFGLSAKSQRDLDDALALFQRAVSSKRNIPDPTPYTPEVRETKLPDRSDVDLRRRVDELTRSL